MPTTSRRANKWIKEKKAKIVKNKLGIFQVQLLSEPSGRKKQPIVMTIDPGSVFTGIGVISKHAILYGATLELPGYKQGSKPKIVANKSGKKIEKYSNSIIEGMDKRRQLRRSRRHRNCRRREARWLNRNKSKIPPSILARKQLELKIATEIYMTETSTKLNVKCITCGIVYEPTSADVIAIVGIVDRNNLSSAAILDKLADMGGPCKDEDVHLYEFNKEFDAKIRHIITNVKELDKNIQTDVKTINDIITQRKELETKLRVLIVKSKELLTNIAQIEESKEGNLKTLQEMTYSRNTKPWDKYYKCGF